MVGHNCVRMREVRIDQKHTFEIGSELLRLRQYSFQYIFNGVPTFGIMRLAEVKKVVKLGSTSEEAILIINKPSCWGILCFTRQQFKNDCV